MTGRGGCRVSTRARVALDSGDATKENRLASRREYHFFSDNFDFVRSSPVRSRPSSSPSRPSATSASRKSPSAISTRVPSPLPPPARPIRPVPEVPSPRRAHRRNSSNAASGDAPPAPRGSIRPEAPSSAVGRIFGSSASARNKNPSRDPGRRSRETRRWTTSVASVRRRSFRNREVFERRATARRRACRGASACARADRYRCPRGGLDRSG